MTPSLRAATALVALTASASLADPVRWDVAAHFPSSLPQTGETMKRMAALSDTLSGGEIELSIAEPGALVPPGEILQSVGQGAVQAGFTAPGFWAGQEPALQVFGGLPFGPEPDVVFAWFYEGGGRAIYEELYGRFGVHAMPCGIIPAEAAGWFNKQIIEASDFAGLKMRIFGLGGLVLQELGGSPQLLSVGDTIPALELGTIDAAEMVMPSVDEQIGLYRFASNYYFPGWHQRATFLDLIVNVDEWDVLDDRQRAILETVCSDNVRYALALGLAQQPDALDALDGHGTTIERLPDAVIATLRDTWEEVAAVQAEESEAFARALGLLRDFAARQERWQSLQAID